MSKSLGEYADWLNSRELMWPTVPDREAPKATASINPLQGICAVIWDLYGTLVRISDGQLVVLHPQQIRMQVALEKTIQEFNMWNSMSRKPGAPWEYMLQQYRKLIDDRRLAGTRRKGDLPEIDLAQIWETLIERLRQNDYEFDESFYGDVSELAEKVAYFFHRNLQAVESMPGAQTTLACFAESPIVQGVLADAQAFSLIQSLRAISAQGKLPPLGQLFEPDLVVLSYQEGIRKPSPSLYETMVERLGNHGIEPDETLYVSSSLGEDLSIARQVGFKTALLVNDRVALRLKLKDLKNPEKKPDRLLTDLRQVPAMVGLS